jgi:hypothetical protein
MHTACLTKTPEWKAYACEYLMVCRVQLQYGRSASVTGVQLQKRTGCKARYHSRMARHMHEEIKVPPGDAGLPVCLDASIKIRLDILTIVDIVLKHSLCHSPTLPAPNGLSMRRPSTPCVLQPAESMLPSLQASTWSLAHSRFNAYMMSKVGSSDAL